MTSRGHDHSLPPLRDTKRYRMAICQVSSNWQHRHRGHSCRFNLTLGLASVRRLNIPTITYSQEHTYVTAL